MTMEEISNQVVRVLFEKGLKKLQEHKIEKAKDYFIDALEESQGLEDEKILKNLYNKLSEVFESLGDSAQDKLDNIEHVKEVFSQDNLYAKSNIILAYNSLGIAYLNESQDKQARESFVKAIEMARNDFDGFLYPALEQITQHFLVISRKIFDSGMEQMNAGKYQEALEIFEDNIKIASNVFLQGHSEVGLYLANAGICLENLNKHEQALDYLYQAIAMFKAFSGEVNSIAVNTTMHHIFNCHSATAKDHSNIFQYSMKALAKMAISFPQDHPNAQSYIVAFESVIQDMLTPIPQRVVEDVIDSDMLTNDISAQTLGPTTGSMQPMGKVPLDDVNM